LNILTDVSPVTNPLPSAFSYPANAAGLCREDALCNIVRLQVTWNNNPSLFATFDSQELYRRTVANGVAVPYIGGDGKNELRVATYNNLTSLPSYYPFAYAPNVSETKDPVALGVGYPLLLALNKDIPVEPNVAAGVAGVFTLKVTATVRNTCDVHTPPGGTLYVVPITSQYLKLNSGAMSDIIATVATEADVYRTPVVGDVQAKEMVGAGRSRVSADPHAVASSRRQVAPRSDSGEQGGAGNYVGSKRAHFMQS
jgi:hypothetical protein